MEKITSLGSEFIVLQKQLHCSCFRSPTPTPLELRPIYEAESPDELALVDAAFAYNCKLLKRSPHHAVVSLPLEGLIDFEVNEMKHKLAVGKF